MTTFSFQPIFPIVADVDVDSRVLYTARAELNRFEIARNDRPSLYFLYLVDIDHLAEIPILTRFQPSEFGTFLRLHVETAFLVA